MSTEKLEHKYGLRRTESMVSIAFAMAMKVPMVIKVLINPFATDITPVCA